MSMTNVKRQAKEAIDALPDKKVREALDFIEFLKRKEGVEPFAARVDKVWKDMKRGFEKAGYRAKDVEGLIKEVRSKKLERRSVGA